MKYIRLDLTLHISILYLSATYGLIKPFYFLFLFRKRIEKSFLEQKDNSR